MYVVFQDSDAFTMIDLLMEDFAMDEAKATDGLPFTSSLFSKNSSAVDTMREADPVRNLIPCV